jgi:hypothetical protein
VPSPCPLFLRSVVPLVAGISGLLDRDCEADQHDIQLLYMLVSNPSLLGGFNSFVIQALTQHNWRAMRCGWAAFGQFLFFSSTMAAFTAWALNVKRESRSWVSDGGSAENFAIHLYPPAFCTPSDTPDDCATSGRVATVLAIVIFCYIFVSSWDTVSTLSWQLVHENKLRRKIDGRINSSASLSVKAPWWDTYARGFGELRKAALKVSRRSTVWDICTLANVVLMLVSLRSWVQYDVVPGKCECHFDFHSRPVFFVYSSMISVLQLHK